MGWTQTLVLVALVLSVMALYAALACWHKLHDSEQKRQSLHRLVSSLCDWRSQYTPAAPDHVHHMGNGSYTSIAGLGRPIGAEARPGVGSETGPAVPSVSFTNFAWSDLHDTSLPSTKEVGAA